MTDYRLQRLDDTHELSRFRSGNAALDAWLTHHALASQRMDSARTFLLFDDEHIAGYFSLTMGSVRKEDAPPTLVRGLPGYPVGSVLLARLAVAADRQGQGLGGLLLAEALRKAVTAGDAAAARLVIVDAIDEDAAHFYAHFGFLAVPQHPRRLYRRMKDIRASLDLAAGPGS